MYFSKTLALSFLIRYNTGNIMDVSFDDEVDADAIVLSWQAGMVGGLGLASILCGDISPSGHLPDTMAYKLEDYPSYSNFGKSLTDMYAEDVYVGYRYFETFANYHTANRGTNSNSQRN